MYDGSGAFNYPKYLVRLTFSGGQNFTVAVSTDNASDPEEAIQYAKRSARECEISTADNEFPIRLGEPVEIICQKDTPLNRSKLSNQP